MKSSTPNDSSPKKPTLQCPLCESQLQRISLICPHCRGEIEFSIQSALRSRQNSSSSDGILTLSQDERIACQKNNQDLKRATFIVILSLSITWFFVYVLTA